VPLWTIGLLALAAFAAGLVDSIAGGGGLVTVPVLLATGLDPRLAIATNKGQACFGAVSSFASFWARDGIDKPRAPLGFVCGFLGALGGGAALLAVRPEPLKPIVVALLLFAAAFVAWPRRAATPDRKGRAWAKHALAPVALVIGFYDGFFGPGTGTILIVAFVALFGDTLTRASGNAKVVNLASNLAAVGLFALRGAVLWRIALPMAVANAAGAFLGSRLALRRGDRFVRLVVIAVALSVVAKMVSDRLRR
jgi:uncharacterized protein